MGSGDFTEIDVLVLVTEISMYSFVQPGIPISDRPVC